LVEQMLALHRSLARARAPHDKESPRRRIDATDRQIDQLVYEPYGLTDEEVRIVEGETARGYGAPSGLWGGGVARYRGLRPRLFYFALSGRVAARQGIAPAPDRRDEPRIDATNRQIAQLVYELCGLTDEEVRIVEGGTARGYGAPSGLWGGGVARYRGLRPRLFYFALSGRTARDEEPFSPFVLARR